MEVYELTPDLGDPRFNQFSFPEDLPSLLGYEHLRKDFEHQNGGKLSWQPTPLAHIWSPQPATGDVRPYNDYPCVDSLPAFSGRAVDALREYLEPNGELLPLETKVGTYFAYNILTKSTALDLSRSKGVFAAGTSKETAIVMDYFAFNEDKLRGHAVFRIREYPVSVFVTDKFKSRAERAGLNGLYFIKVWPFAEGESWEQAEAERRRARRKALSPLNGQCVVIKLGVCGINATASEEQQGHRLVSRLAHLLAESRGNSLDDDFLGAIDHLTTANSELQIVLVCPNADRLAEMMEPWWSSIDWPGPVHLVKRYGNAYDDRVKTDSFRVK